MVKLILPLHPMKLPTILILTIFPGASLHAEVPSALNYQGRVLQNGQPFDGTGHFVFGIFEGPTLLWTNKLPVPSPLNDPATTIDSSDAKPITVRNGVFSIRLGEGDANNTPVGTDVFFKFDGTQRVRTDVKLKVWFSPAAEGPYTKLAPDISFASVPFAQVAGVAVSVKEGTIGTPQMADGAVTSEKMSGGSVGSAQLADSAITEEKLMDGAVTNSKISEGSVGSAQLATGVVTTEKLATGAVITDKLGPDVVESSKVQDGSLQLADLAPHARNELSPPGAISAYAGSEAPTGWLLCNGAAYSRTEYSALFEVIGTQYGVGNGSTTFNVPNFQGLVPRGVGNQTINGRTKVGPGLGASQEDQFQGHFHSYVNDGLGSGGSAGGSTWPTNTPYITTTSGPVSDGSNGTPRIGAETRAAALGVNFIIKY